MSQSNVVAFRRKPVAPVVPTVEDVLPKLKDENKAILQFVVDSIYPWAWENGIDTETREFKLEIATISTVLQGMAFRAEKK